jgi:hypothetical protein
MTMVSLKWENSFLLKKGENFFVGKTEKEADLVQIPEEFAQAFYVMVEAEKRRKGIQNNNLRPRYPKRIDSLVVETMENTYCHLFVIYLMGFKKFPKKHLNSYVDFYEDSLKENFPDFESFEANIKNKKFPLLCRAYSKLGMIAHSFIVLGVSKSGEIVIAEKADAHDASFRTIEGRDFFKSQIENGDKVQLLDFYEFKEKMIG